MVRFLCKVLSWRSVVWFQLY